MGLQHSKHRGTYGFVDPFDIHHEPAGDSRGLGLPPGWMMEPAGPINNPRDLTPLSSAAVSGITVQASKMALL